MLHRRQLFRGALCAAVYGSARSANASPGYPSRPVRWIVPFPAGGPSDILARVIAHELSERLEQPFVVENRAGGAGNVGTQAVATAEPDGHTLLLVAAPNAINAALYPSPAFDFGRDIRPVASIARGPLLMLVNPELPAQSVPEFLAHARARPGQINFASPGLGTPPHLAAELLKRTAGIDLVHVPYRGVAPALSDLIAGQVQLAFDPIPSSIGFVREGQLRALAVTTDSRSDTLPDLACLNEWVPGFEASTWFGLGAPRNFNAASVKILNRAVNDVLSDEKIGARLTSLGVSPFIGSPGEFDAFLAGEIQKWRAFETAIESKP